MNWKKKNSKGNLMRKFWTAAKSTYLQQYKKTLEDLKKASVVAYKDFINRDVHKFCKAFLSFDACSDTIDNNCSESFNSYVLNARGKHIIHMCEEIRDSLMVRHVNRAEELSKYTERICPIICKKLEKYRVLSTKCVALPALGRKFEVVDGANKFVVDMNERSCSCRRWQLRGIPCIHACSAIHFLNEHPIDYVNEYYSVAKCKASYSVGIQPLNGESMWPEVEGFTVLPQKMRRMPGRPKKKRVRSLDEIDTKNPNRLKRAGLVMTCKKCNKVGHNSKGCKSENVVPQPIKEKRNRGRPSKQGGQPSEQSKGKTVAEKSTLAKERNMARTGAGVYISGSTGNIYYHMPTHKKVTQVTSSSTSSMRSGKVDGSSTQESRAHG